MKPLFANLFLSALILVGLSGCGSSPSPLVDAGTVSANDTTAASDAAADGGNKTPEDSTAKRFERDGITAEIATWEETQIIVAQHTGKVVVLDVWSTYCEPCIEEFPNLVALQKQYADQIVCISFNINYVGLEDTPPESNSEEILEFLALQKSQLHNIISSTPDEEFYPKTISENFPELGSIPAVFVYGTDGKLKQRFDNDKTLYGKEGFTYKQHIIPLIEKLLAEKAAK